MLTPYYYIGLVYFVLGRKGRGAELGKFELEHFAGRKESDAELGKFELEHFVFELAHYFAHCFALAQLVFGLAVVLHSQLLDSFYLLQL